MTALAKIADNLKKLVRNSDRVVAIALKRKSKEIEELNRDQLRIGQKSDETFNIPYVDNPINRGKNRANEPIQLFDTGAYYRGIKAEVKPGVLRIVNRDSKDKKISEKYGKENKGLTPDSQNTVRIEILLPLREETLKFIQNA